MTNRTPSSLERFEPVLFAGLCVKSNDVKGFLPGPLGGQRTRSPTTMGLDGQKFTRQEELDLSPMLGEFVIDDAVSTVAPKRDPVSKNGQRKYKNTSGNG